MAHVNRIAQGCKLHFISVIGIVCGHNECPDIIHGVRSKACEITAEAVDRPIDIGMVIRGGRIMSRAPAHTARNDTLHIV